MLFNFLYRLLGRMFFLVLEKHRLLDQAKYIFYGSHQCYRDSSVFRPMM